jgi:hypothetical protein
MTKAGYDPDRSLVLIEGLSHFITNFLQNLASCHTAFSRYKTELIILIYFVRSNSFLITYFIFLSVII